MTDFNSELCINTLIAAYPDFGNGRIESVKAEWKDVIRSRDYQEVNSKIKHWIENHDEPPAITDIVEDPIGDDGTMRQLARLYAEICHLTLPKLKSDAEAMEWLKKQEGEFEQQ